MAGMRNRRDRLISMVGTEVVRFQEQSTTFDRVAAQVLAIERSDLPCMTMLLFGRPSTIDGLAVALDVRKAEVVSTVQRLERAGYARRRLERGVSVIELTEHAREWIERIWAPLREDGGRLLATYSTRDLALMRTFMARAYEIQEWQLRVLRKSMDVPGQTARPHLRGGLAAAALRRVQLFVEANLAQPIQLGDLAARADLSLHHFARAFKTSAGMTPRAFIEQRRIERARLLIEQSTASLAEIAIETGFKTQSRLTTTFRRRTGFTPAEYRRGRRRGRDRRRVDIRPT